MPKSLAKLSPKEGHLPECELVTFREYRQQMEAKGYDVSDLPHDPDDPWYDQAGFVNCAKGCPHLAKTIEWANEKAASLNPAPLPTTEGQS